MVLSVVPVYILLLSHYTSSQSCRILHHIKCCIYFGQQASGPPRTVIKTTFTKAKPRPRAQFSKPRTG